MNGVPIHFRCERCFAEELKKRVPQLTWLASQDNPTGEPPYGIVQCDEARETTPESGVFYVAMAILVTTVMTENQGGEHACRVQAVRAALEVIPKQGKDVDNDLVIHGFYVQRTTPANEGREQGTLFELNVGCGVLEKNNVAPGYMPDEAVA